ncbi:MAG: acyl CoA:acetate/3-ketoacid CoA transferase, partial [Rhodoplanes sp.]
LGMAECDRAGNVNVSRFGTRLIGVGGFINISQNSRRLVFAGTFTAGGLEVALEAGKLKILKEGKQRKFVEKVGQISFSGQYAYDRNRMVLYVTERCVFRRVRAGLALIEVAPGIDIERDILAHMGFKPIIGEPDLMDLRIFRPEPMGLETHLLNLDLPDRITYDPQRNILFLNFEGMYIRVKDDIVALCRLLEERCKKIGKRVGVFINYDNFRISEDTYDDYAEMDRYMLDHYYTTITRFATSAFMRMKLGEAFTRRNIAPHVFEKKEDAQAFLSSLEAQEREAS